MSMLLPLIPDLIIAAVLILFAWRGAKRGLILTLCGLAALIVAFVGATYFARFLAPAVSAQIEPFLAGAIEQSILPQAGAQGPAVEFDLGPLDTFLSPEWRARIGDAVQQGVQDAIAAVSKELAVVLAGMLTYVVLFLFGFVVILLIWFVFSHALDLAFRLPVLDTFNTAGGLILGLLKGLVLCYILAFLTQRYPTLLPEGLVQQTYLLRFFVTVSPWSLLR